MLDLQRLYILRQVATHGSLSRAAEAMSYTPSAISQAIGALERESEAVLLERLPRGVRLTEAGRALVAHTDTILAELRAAETTLLAIRRGEAGRLRFGSFTTANAVLMPRAAASFRAHNPDVDLELIEVDVDESLQMVAQRDLDLALVYEFPIVVPIAKPQTLELMPLIRDPLHVALPVSHPLGRRRRLRLRELAGETWIQGVHRGSTIDVLPRACRLAGFEPRIAFRTDDQTTVRGLVAAGIGIALAPSITVGATPPGIIIRPLFARSLTRDVMVAVPLGTHRLPAALTFVEHLRRAATALSDGSSIGEARHP